MKRRLPATGFFILFCIGAAFFCGCNSATMVKIPAEKEYWIGRYEVTQAQYEEVMGYNPSYFKSPDRPVEQVSWEDAMEFCRKLNEIHAEDLPAGYKYSLPTEAQWEYACRAGTATSLNNGVEMKILGESDSPDLDAVGWYLGNCGQGFELEEGFGITAWPERQYDDKYGGTHPVGLKEPNAWGLYDMHGNVNEWCLNMYNPDQVRGVPRRAFRGGSWLNGAATSNAASRHGYPENFHIFHVGFRVALVSQE